MLKSLSIENVAVAKQIDVDFSDGYTVITGETGAGKSILVDCLGLLCGDKAGRDMVRTGENTATVIGIFEGLESVAEKLAELSIYSDENGELEIIRTISAEGKSSVKINRKPCPLSVLREAGQYLIHIQTQDERYALTAKNAYINILDDYADLTESLTEYQQIYSIYKAKQNEIDELTQSLRDKNMFLDILKYQVQEIDQAKLGSEDEEEKLLRLRTKCKNAERIRKYTNFVHRALLQNEKGNSVSDLLEKAGSAILQLSDVLEGADDLAKSLEDYRYEIINVAETVEASLDNDEVENPEKQLTIIETKLFNIDRLKKKYGSTIKEIKDFRENAAQKIKELESGDVRLEELEKEKEVLYDKCFAYAQQLHDIRVEAAKKLEAGVLNDLSFLEMPKVRFSIQVSKRPGTEDPFLPTGFDDVDFLLSVNPGEALQSLGKVASGGEISRVMLAIKASVNEKTSAGTIVFDEIDTGVSGSTSERIGIMLQKLTSHSQVIAITHSPQVAALADTHLLIRKSIDGERAESRVLKLSDTERVEEIARIIGGISVTEKQMAAAKEMLSQKY